MKKTSPVIKKGKPITLSFPEAIAEIIGGAKVTRVEWDNLEEYGYLKDGWLTIHTKGKDCFWKVGDGDMSPADWVIIPQGN